MHRALIAHLRKSDVKKDVEGLDDDQIARLLFANFRKSGADLHGLRLTHIGLQVMMQLFKSYEVPTPNKENITSACLLFLDRRARLPYYVSREKIVVFEPKLAVMLKLAGGATEKLGRHLA